MFSGHPLKVDTGVMSGGERIDMEEQRKRKEKIMAKSSFSLALPPSKNLSHTGPTVESSLVCYSRVFLYFPPD